MPFELSFMCFFNCVDSLLAYHNGAIIATLSKNDVPFDVGDKCSYSIALFREQKCYQFYTCFRFIVCIYVTSTVLA